MERKPECNRVVVRAKRRNSQQPRIAKTKYKEESRDCRNQGRDPAQPARPDPPHFARRFQICPNFFAKFPNHISNQPLRIQPASQDNIAPERGQRRNWGRGVHRPIVWFQIPITGEPASYTPTTPTSTAAPPPP